MKQLSGWQVAVACAAVFSMAGTGWAASLLVDNFNRGDKPNALGGDFGSWDKDPNDATQSCAVKFERSDALGDAGYSLRLDYDVDSPNPAYNGFWMKLTGADLSSYKTLTLHIKGDASRGYTTQVKLELKNGTEVGRYLLKGITDQWQEVRIPLKSFEGIANWKDMQELVVVFDDLTSTKKVGTVYLDDVAFEG